MEQITIVPQPPSPTFFLFKVALDSIVVRDRDAAAAAAALPTNSGLRLSNRRTAMDDAFAGSVLEAM